MTTDAVAMASSEEQLLELFRLLEPDEQATLLAFAEFLRQRRVNATVMPRAETVAIPEPVPIVRPAQESVVAGLKRLSQTYPMLSKTEMLTATSDLVARNIMQGTDPAHVIDQLEDIFREHYRRLREQARQ
jgi:hypothetical protein